MTPLTLGIITMPVNILQVFERTTLVESILKYWTTFHNVAQGFTFQWAGGNCIVLLFVTTRGLATIVSAI